MKKKPRAEGTLKLKLKSKKHLDSIMRALGPELVHSASDRARVVMVPRGNLLTLQFQAHDSSALRAVMSSYLRMLVASLGVLESVSTVLEARRRSRLIDNAR